MGGVLQGLTKGGFLSTVHLPRTSYNWYIHLLLLLLFLLLLLLPLAPILPLAYDAIEEQNRLFRRGQKKDLDLQLALAWPPLCVRMIVGRWDKMVDGQRVQIPSMDLVEARDAAHLHGGL